MSTDDYTASAAAKLRELFDPDHRGTQPEIASITFVGVPPINIMRCVRPAGATGLDGTTRTTPTIVYASIGCGREEMGDPTSLIQGDNPAGRAEVALEVDQPIDGVARMIATIAASPMVEGLVVEPDAIIELGFPLWHQSAFRSVVTGQTDLSFSVNVASHNPPDLGDMLAGIQPSGDTAAADVSIVRLLPATAVEAAWARVRSVPQLRQAWDQAGIDCLDPYREAIQL